MNITTKDTNKEITLNEVIFNREYNQGLVHQTVTTLLNSYRSGNSAQKTRAEVRGGGRKPWNQKGSGRARAGAARSAGPGSGCAPAPSAWSARPSC